jgi:AraC-like DNA-binding protein
MWLVRGGHVPRRERILPSGTVEVVVNLVHDRVCIEGTIDGARGRTVSGTAVSGTYSCAFEIDAMQHAAMMGVNFTPGGASAVLGVPAAEFAGTHVDLAALWGETMVRELRERLCAARSDQARFEHLEAILTERLQSSSSPLHASVRYAIARFQDTRFRASVQDVARECGLSHRRFLTVFRMQVGLPPKHFCRIGRFRQLHARAQRTRHVDWSQLALACGFYDQAHLANEFRKLCGLTPTEFQDGLRDRTDLLHGHIVLP